MGTAQRKTTHLSLQRAVAVLKAFSEAEPELSVTEISRRLGIHKSTVSRILATLLDEGMVWHNTGTGKYSLGMSLVEMAGVALGQIDVRAAAIPHLEELCDRTGETVFVSIRRDREAVTVAHVPAHKPVRHVVWIGRSVPLHSTAAGKVFLAGLASSGVEWRPVAYGDVDTAVGGNEFGDQLVKIAEQGFATEVDDFEQGSAAVASPIVGDLDDVIAAVSIAGPTYRFGPPERQRAVVHLLDAAAAIAADLGVGAGRVRAGLR